MSDIHEAYTEYLRKCKARTTKAKEEYAKKPNGEKPSSELTKLEYFAGLAMQGLISTGAKRDWGIEDLSLEAVRHAEGLLKELEEK